MTLAQATSMLIHACNYRDAVVASGHTEKLDLAVEQYVMALSRATDAVEAASAQGKEGGG